MKIFVIAEREQPVVELCAGARQFADEVDLIALPTTSVAPGVADTVYRLVFALLGKSSITYQPAGNKGFECGVDRTDRQFLFVCDVALAYARVRIKAIQDFKFVSCEHDRFSSYRKCSLVFDVQLF